MKSLLITLIFLSNLLYGYFSQDEENDIPDNTKKCRERLRLIGTDKGDLYTVTDATLGQKLMLQCHYCNENDDQQPKMWYKSSNLSEEYPVEIQLNMETNLTMNRIFVNMEHTLIIRNVTLNDTGLYYCFGLNGKDTDYKYNYLVDVVYDNVIIQPEKGNLATWRKYHDENFVPVNKLFRFSTGADFLYMREVLHIRIEIVTEWEPWGPCEICGRPQGAGQKMREGLCRLKTNSLYNGNESRSFKNYGENFLVNAFELSCRSMHFGRVFPRVSNTTKILPHFIQVEHCEGRCSPDAEGSNKGWKTGKSRAFKYRKTIVLAENDHLTLVCPESTLENSVKWKRNGITLEAGESVAPASGSGEPRITVDTFNTLYFFGVTRHEEGNYSCEVDTIRMQSIVIYVVSKSRLLTQAFVRHMVYLAFVLSLTSSCYCAGLIITWTKRHKFKTYEELMKEKLEYSQDDDVV